MTDTQSKDSQEMLDELSKPYGCYGIKTVNGMSVWIDQWLANGGEERALDNLVMLVNKSTGYMNLWISEVFYNERK